MRRHGAVVLASQEVLQEIIQVRVHRDPERVSVGS